MYLLQHLITWPEIGQGRWQDSESAIIHTRRRTRGARTRTHTLRSCEFRFFFPFHPFFLFKINSLMTLPSVSLHGRARSTHLLSTHSLTLAVFRLLQTNAEYIQHVSVVVPVVCLRAPNVQLVRCGEGRIDRKGGFKKKKTPTVSLWNNRGWRKHSVLFTLKCRLPSSPTHPNRTTVLLPREAFRRRLHQSRFNV